MSLPKRKSRKLVVSGKCYRYIVSKGHNLGGDTFSLNVTVQSEEGCGSKLVTEGLTTRDFWLDFSDGAREKDSYSSLTPAHISRIVELALTRGWAAEGAADPFVVATSKAELNC